MPSLLTEIFVTPLEGGHIAVHAKSVFTGRENRMVLPMDTFSFGLAWAEWRHGRKLIQDAFPELDDAQREFLLTGTTQAEWDAAFPPEDEEEETPEERFARHAAFGKREDE